jgi:HTH-type transcriptional regulator/antitoxin HipB
MSEVHSTAQIGQRVRQTRQQLGLTQPQLALALALAVGVGIRFIVDLEAGKSTVRLDKVLQVLAGLGLVLWISDSADLTATDV